MELPFEDDSFDYVTIGFGLRNVPDYSTVLREMYRVTKPGGQVVCLETSQPTLIGYRQASLFYVRYIMPLLESLLPKVMMNTHGYKNQPVIFPIKMH
jgi:demethylmenaquinone methyltransferase/2-methoxy-6-polyprenyl-1,4-benzoquinol methylase